MNGQVEELEMHETSAGEATTAVGPRDGTDHEANAFTEGEVIQIEPASTKAETNASFLSRDEAEELHKRWNDIQIKFVDEPHSAVEQADALVTEVIAKITREFADEHSSVDSQWDKSNDASTEDLRKSLQRFRSLFNRLVV